MHLAPHLNEGFAEDCATVRGANSCFSSDIFFLTDRCATTNRGKRVNPADIKDMLLRWSKAKTRGYEARVARHRCQLAPRTNTLTDSLVTQGVNVENFSGSWADGLAFCALIHHFFPDSFDFATLDPNNRRENLEIAFKTIE